MWKHVSAAAMVAALAGCGGGPHAAPGGAPLPPAELAARALGCAVSIESPEVASDYAVAGLTPLIAYGPRIALLSAATISFDRETEALRVQGHDLPEDAVRQRDICQPVVLQYSDPLRGGALAFRMAQGFDPARDAPQAASRIRREKLMLSLPEGWRLSYVVPAGIETDFVISAVRGRFADGPSRMIAVMKNSGEDRVTVQLFDEEGRR